MDPRTIGFNLGVNHFNSYLVYAMFDEYTAKQN